MHEANIGSIFGIGFPAWTGGAMQFIASEGRARFEARADALAARYVGVRALTEALIAPLSDADATVQSMEDASPAKWHLAHTTWFLDTFILRDFVTGYTLHDARFPSLFNSSFAA